MYFNFRHLFHKHSSIFLSLPWDLRELCFLSHGKNCSKDTHIHKLFKTVLVCKYKHTDLSLTCVKSLYYLTRISSVNDIDIFDLFNAVALSRLIGIISNSLGYMWLKTALNVQLFLFLFSVVISLVSVCVKLLKRLSNHLNEIS